MRKLVLLPALAALALPAFAQPAPAAPSAAAPLRRAMTCPIGGEKFQFETVESIVSWGERPDGKPYGSYPLQLPECPKNGLVLFKDYDPAELAMLEPLVASDEYQALRKEHVPFYRAYWLMGRMGVLPAPRLIALQRAIWAADSKPELRARYLAEFAEETAKLPAKPEDLNWIGMEGRAINALRELGRFEDAEARLAKLPLSVLAVAEPDAADKSPAAAQLRIRRAWFKYLTAIKPVIARRDSSAEPFSMLPRREWAARCIEAKDLSESQQAHCTAEAAAVEEFRAALAKVDADPKPPTPNSEKTTR